MRKSLKIRLAVFLTIMLTLPTVVSALPMTAIDASAASSASISCGFYPSDSGIQVEVGQEFYYGDYFSIYTSSKYLGVASMVKASYSSSKSAVASINSKGYLTAKAEGTTEITVKYKGGKHTMKVEVVKAGTFAPADTLAAAKNTVESFAAKIPSKITTKNGYDLVKLRSDFYNDMAAYEKINEDGILKKEVTFASGYTYMTTSYTGPKMLAVPQAGRYRYLNAMMSVYADKYSPTATRGAKTMQIKSASATTKGVTVKLKKKLTAEQVLAAKFENRYMEDNLTAKNGQAYIYVSLINGDKYISAKGLLKKGSNKVVITPYTYDYIDGKNVIKKAKLSKGKVYTIGSSVQWSKGKKVKVK